MTFHKGDRPPHHRPGGGFQTPWPNPRRPGESQSFLRWQWERWTSPVAPTPGADAFPVVDPRVHHPSADPSVLTLTWIGHATFLIQLGGLNFVTDPHFSKRASPVQWAGPRRMARLPCALDDLPRIDGVVLSHDHYDHLDRTSVGALARHSPEAQWFTPLGYRTWLVEQGVRHVQEADWWQERAIGDVQLACVPVQHWTRRGRTVNERLWAGWTAKSGGAQTPTRSVFFAGDSGYFGGFEEIGRRLGPFDASLLPIGAYDPRWFMRSAHMNPEEAVQVYLDLGAQGTMVGMHWGTFRLTDEDPLEPPLRTRSAWDAARLDSANLWIPRHGETLEVGINGGG